MHIIIIVRVNNNYCIIDWCIHNNNNIIIAIATQLLTEFVLHGVSESSSYFFRLSGGPLASIDCMQPSSVSMHF